MLANELTRLRYNSEGTPEPVRQSPGGERGCCHTRTSTACRRVASSLCVVGVRGGGGDNEVWLVETAISSARVLVDTAHRQAETLSLSIPNTFRSRTPHMPHCCAPRG